ncbi:hypothetical protein FEM48_Zijuj09G0085200 [Ziziphus jujuba var. spinosa]|uniref:Uncharacterized protein n=1 Tax=Ziziphus jujuba var. spinosa TaxID=714518 RepID=A0A978URY1_ZIZJJ|nr:hypothetical protein FEM48_Zijuj09G0085200 [Ziziphus jujuba var. spinosa]
MRPTIIFSLAHLQPPWWCECEVIRDVLINGRIFCWKLRNMLSFAKRLRSYVPCLQSAAHQLRWARTDAGPPRRRGRTSALAKVKAEEKSEWWIVDGEMHEIGDHVPPRERFVIPRDNIPNKRRKQLREQFMRRTRLVLKESEHEPWCKRYMELYQELRENWERLYWDEGYSKKIAQDHANYESEDDDQDFSPYRSRRSNAEQMKGRGSGSRQGDTWEKVSQIRDKFEYDRERRMRDKAFAPMNRGPISDWHDSNSQNRSFDAERYFSESEEEEKENY